MFALVATIHIHVETNVGGGVQYVERQDMTGHGDVLPEMPNTMCLH